MNDPLRKPRGDSKLNRLPTKRQDALIEFAATHTLLEARAWLRRQKVLVTYQTLAVWLSSQRLRQQLHLNEAAVETHVEDVKSASEAEGRKCDPDEIQRIGQAFFSKLALEQQNPNIWNMTQRLALKKEQLLLEQSKFRESLRSKLRMGLELIAEAFRESPQARKFYEQACALIDTEVKLAIEGSALEEQPGNTEDGLQPAAPPEAVS
jgi:hypothetical protein